MFVCQPRQLPTSAGPIQTGIWSGGLGSVAGFEGPVWERALGKLRRFAEREWADPAWFLPPKAVAERVWKVLPRFAAASSTAAFSQDPVAACMSHVSKVDMAPYTVGEVLQLPESRAGGASCEERQRSRRFSWKRLIMRTAPAPAGAECGDACSELRGHARLAEELGRSHVPSHAPD